MYICEFEFVEDVGVVIAWPFWPGREAGTEGADLHDAVDMAADWLREVVLDELAKGHEIPDLVVGNEPSRGGRIIAVAVDASLKDVPSMSLDEAAERLGISRPRVSQLCRDGLLDSWKVGSARRVSVESVENRLAGEHRPGRPWK